MKEAKIIDVNATSLFISCGSFSDSCLKLRNQMLGQSNPIIVIDDDFSTGPLQDVDQLEPFQRINWWKTVWSANRWCFHYTNEYERELADSLKRHTAHQKRFLSMLTSANSIVSWVGNTASDKLMLAMIASLAQGQLSVIELAKQLPKRYSHNGICTLGMCPVDALLQLMPRPLSDSERIILKQQWNDWKQRGQGWRETDSDGNVIEYPLDHLDRHLLKVIKRATKQGSDSGARVIGDFMAEYPGWVLDEFLLWRLDRLQQMGRITLIPNDTGRWPCYPQVIMVSDV